jgi:hypothetical protein
MPAVPGGFGGFGAGGAAAQAGAGSGGGGGLLASLFGGGAPAAAGAGGGGGGILGGMNMGQIKNIIDRMGGINGIMDGIGKAQKFMGTMQQFAPMAKVLLGAFAGKKTAEAEEDELEGIPRRRRRRRRRRGYASSRRRSTKVRHSLKRSATGKRSSRLGKKGSSRPHYGVRKKR